MYYGSQNAITIFSFADTPCNDSRTLLPGAKGILMSPNFPKVYPGNSQCYMYLKAPSSGYHIQLHFDEHFHLEWTPGCASDYVQVDSNPSGSQHSPATLQTFCGTIVPRPIVSRGDSILVIFASDFKNSFTGFKLTYSVKAEGKWYMHWAMNTATSNKQVASTAQGIDDSLHHKIRMRKVPNLKKA